MQIAQFSDIVQRRFSEGLEFHVGVINGAVFGVGHFLQSRYELDGYRVAEVEGSFAIEAAFGLLGIGS